MKTLDVEYLPRGERSSTKKIVDSFIAELKAKGENIEILDLLKDTPDFLTAEIIDAYIHRNYLGEKLDSAKQKVLAKLDRMTSQLKAADVVVVAFPMYNLSMPAMVKAYFDSVMQKGITWDMKKTYIGLMKGKKALIITSSGGAYSVGGDMPEYCVSLARAEFNFMGFSDIRCINAEGVNAPSSDREKLLSKSKGEAADIVKDWYK